MSLPNAEQAIKVGFVFSNDPDPLLIERMRALEESGWFETHAIYWHRLGSDLRFPFSPAPLEATRFTKTELPDPRRNGFHRALLTWKFSRAIRRWYLRHRFQILHVVYPNMLIATRLAMLPRQIPLVYDIWDIQGGKDVSSIKRSMYRTLLANTPHVFTTSQAYIDHFLEPQRLLPAGTQATNVSNAPYDRPALPKAGAAGELVVGCLGNLRVHKQINMLVQAVAEVRRAGHNVRVRLSGAGSKKQYVESLTTEHDFVEYTGPYSYGHDAPTLYSQLDIVFAVYPLEIYNYRVHVARRLHDAVLSETPMIVSAGSEMANIVEREGVGWSVGHESVDELAQVITSVCETPSTLVDRVAKLRDVRQNHCFEGYRDQYLAAYREIADNTTSVPG